MTVMIYEHRASSCKDGTKRGAGVGAGALASISLHGAQYPIKWNRGGSRHAHNLRVNRRHSIWLFLARSGSTPFSLGVGLYTGLLIRREEADKLSGSRASYCFDLDVNEDPDEETPENAYSVDAYGCGNWTRFINHSCSPNLQIITVVYDTMPEDNMPYLALVATEDIPAFTELTFD
ncbi:hypothetical protein C8J57DRAFT_1474092, partial [Mycena rebaudengoi]